jgi:hypothetical protein
MWLDVNTSALFSSLVRCPLARLVANQYGAMLSVIVALLLANTELRKWTFDRDLETNSQQLLQLTVALALC